ncbi:MAG TPA: transketolase [Steroidobacteraceae bacterium]|nr:transketolase [Steroidobacteraceae bacterium]
MPDRRQLANALRALSMDAVQQANSGHPGMPMGMADIAEVLWNDFLKHNPGNPAWFDRDRFVLSNGHGSMLLYSLLHLTGYPLALGELKRFRQLGSHTPGHPERDPKLGIETTTGPLGQGLANAVGMALAERMLGATFNRPGFTLVDHHTYVFLGDGCLMEGISHEASSLAGTLGLGKLICFYDDNGISIDGHVQGWFTDDTPKRFEAYGWQVIRAVDGHDSDAILRAVRRARRETTKPTLICCKTIIGYGAPNKQGTEATHGAALGADEVAAARATLGWPYPPFEVPDEIRKGWDARARGKRAEAKWQKLFNEYRTAYPALAAEFERRVRGDLPADWAEFAHTTLVSVQAQGGAVATRQSSQAALNAFAPKLPELVGGSADLTGSNNTWLKSSRGITRSDASGNYLWYGVREFGMSAMINGIALHGGLTPYGGTFLVFSDYARNAVRMAALMQVPSIFVWSHDSIGLGEDGPTHQPIEHLASLRLIPNLTLWRPCDDVEAHVAWIDALERRDGPTGLVLTRQAVPHQARSAEQLAAVRRGGYVLVECDGAPELVLLATGSEVQLAVEAARALTGRGRRVRVVSLPSTERFDAQPADYRASVLPHGVPRVAVEAGVRDYWCRYTANREWVVGIDTFGASAPAKDLFKHFAVTTDHLVAVATQALGG